MRERKGYRDLVTDCENSLSISKRSLSRSMNLRGGLVPRCLLEKRIYNEEITLDAVLINFHRSEMFIGRDRKRGKQYYIFTNRRNHSPLL